MAPSLSGDGVSRWIPPPGGEPEVRAERPPWPSKTEKMVRETIEDRRRRPEISPGGASEEWPRRCQATGFLVGYRRPEESRRFEPSGLRGRRRPRRWSARRSRIAGGDRRSVRAAPLRNGPRCRQATGFLFASPPPQGPSKTHPHHRRCLLPGPRVLVALGVSPKNLVSGTLLPQGSVCAWPSSNA